MTAPLREIVKACHPSTGRNGRLSAIHFVDTLVCGHTVTADPNRDETPRRRRCKTCAKKQLISSLLAQAESRAVTRDVPTSIEIVTALEEVISVALDCRERWSRGHEDRVTRAQSIATRVRAVIGVTR